MRDGRTVPSSDHPMLVFVHVSKTGGSTLTHMLRSSYGLRHCQVEPWHSRWADPPFSADDLVRLRSVYPNLRSIAGHRLFGHVDLGVPPAELAYFVFMRDPLKAAASRFQAKVRSGQTDLTIERWVARDWTRNRHTKQIAGVDDLALAIRIIREKRMFVGLTERFDESLVMMKRLLADDLRISYRRVNVARDKSRAISMLEDDRTRRLLADSQRLDIELYDFVRSELYPGYQRSYGESLDRDVRAFRDDNRGFNGWNRSLSRLKHYTVYRPALRRSRRRADAIARRSPSEDPTAPQRDRNEAPSAGSRP